MMTNSMQRIRVATALLGVLVVTGACPTHATPVFDQPTNLNGAYASQNDPSGGLGNFATVYDNFTIGTGATITDVSWVGSYFNGAPAAISGFTLTFYADNAGQPGTALATDFIVGNANETSLGLDDQSDPAFSYSAILNTSFAATAGTQYWLSIVADMGFPPQWGWEYGTGGDNSAYQDFFGIRSPIANDFAFSLDGVPLSAVPEPGTLTSACTAVLAGLGCTWRRRRRTAA
ncbi:hypothetical protein [Paludisphaera borealis]|nr:hypothetical protein [Paludisphaera borealis]